ncbi:MAG: NPCBM/NEW2 domain-containing protein, partial [Phycisphaerae bacterium]|nr:NPCBM/NEW2 domain-containing protein [Phycisphaerae bacterium]
SPAVNAQSEVRYEAVLSDGTRVEGDRLTGWHEPGAVPHLEGVPLHDAKRQLLWFRNRSVTPYNPSRNRLGFVEFVGGDRFVGRVVGWQPSSESDGVYVRAHLQVAPAAPLHVPGQRPAAHAHILPGRIQRVVWGSASQRRLQPGTLYYADGRQLGFLHLRWQQNSVLLLLKDGTREVELSKIAEVHLPRIDPWQAYYEELAVLSPVCRSRLVRLETAGGLIATGSGLRFHAAPYGTPRQKQQAIDRLKRLDEQIIKANLAREAGHKELQQARAEYQRQLAEGEARRKAAKQISDKAVADTRQRIDNLRKADAARLTKQRQQLGQELRAAEQAMQQRLAAMPAGKRDKELKAFRQKQAQSRKSRAKSFEQERLKLERQRKKELDGFIKGETQKLKKHEQDLARQLAPARRPIAKWEQDSKRLETLRSQRASARGPQGYPDSWYHMVQPVWSLDPLWMPFRSIHTRWSFAPDQVPLSRVYPAATVSPSLLPWHLDRNSVGQLLRSGGRQHGWGFAVHAYSELSFALPQCAKSFRSRLGLDRLVGTGGCVRARVYVGSVKTRPLYQSPLLVGSKKTVDTGWIPLRLPSKGPKRLILQVDPAHDNRPPGADPLNIRDKLDWLDPQLGLDMAKLQDEVRRRIGQRIQAWQGWTVTLDQRGVYTWTGYLDKTEGSGAGCFRTMIRAQGQPLRLSREMTIAPGDNWLVVHVGVPTGRSLQPKTITLHVGDQEIQPQKIPTRQAWQRLDAPLVFPLAKYRGKKVTLELKQATDGKFLYWRDLGTSKELPPAYRLAQILVLAKKSDLQVSYGLGRALQLLEISNQEKLAALEITELGGVVNFRNRAVGRISYDELATVLVGCDWKGGDKTFMTLKKMPSLKTLLLAGDCGVSSGAVEKLQAEMPDLTITHFDRTPSVHGGACSFTFGNRTGKEVAVFWVRYTGHLHLYCNLKPGGKMKRGIREGYRFEAYYLRKDYTRPEDYNRSKPISRFVAKGDSIWEIKPPGK